MRVQQDHVAARGTRRAAAHQPGAEERTAPQELEGRPSEVPGQSQARLGGD